MDPDTPMSFRGLSRLGVRSRLVLLAVLPLAGLTFFAWQVAVPKIDAAAQSRDVRDGADLVGNLTQARYRVAVERIIGLALATADDLGLDDAQSEALFGLDLREELETARGSVDEVIEALPPMARLDGPLELLEKTRRDFDGEQPGADRFVAGYEQVESGLQAVVEAEAVELDHLVVTADVFAGIHDASSALPLVADTVDAGLNQVVAVGP